MRKILLIVVLSIIAFQYTEAITNYEVREQSLEHERDVRGIIDILNNIRTSAKNAAQAIKYIADVTKGKIKQWIENVKERARNTKEKLGDRIKEIRAKSKAALEKLIGTGKLVKECFKKQNEGLEELLKQIIKHVSKCISDNLISLAHLDKNTIDLELNYNETNFISDVENKMNNCAKQKDIEGCLYKVRQDIYEAMENTENEVLTNRMETRGITDDLLDAVISCSVEGLIDASNAIAAQSTKIIACVIEG